MITTILKRRQSNQHLVLVVLIFVFLTAESQTYRETKLVAHDGAELDQFGASVAISGDWAAVGAPGRDDRGSVSGAVYMFRKSTGRWRFSQKLLANDGMAGDAFSSLSIYNNYLAIGATRARYNGIASGAVYIFKRMDTAWVQARKIGPEPAVAGSLFGLSMSLRGDYMVVGSRHDREAGVQYGAAYVFNQNGGDWTQQARLTASDRKVRQWFGHSVSLFDSLVFIGAPYDSNRNGEFAGAAYFFRRSGTRWNEVKKIVAENGLPDDLAGDVALYGKHAVLGAPSSILVLRRGVAHAFKENKNSWSQRQTISGSEGNDGDGFGSTIVVEAQVMLMGASQDTTNGIGSGAAYLFLFEDSVWTEKHKLLASDGRRYEAFGVSCDLDGSTVIIGAPDAGGTFSAQGAAYIYEDKTVSVEAREGDPTGFQLHQNYPNPFNSATEIKWQIPETRWVTLRAYNLVGKEIALFVNEMKAAGTYSTTFDAHELASGVYFCRLMAGSTQLTRRMLLIK